MSQEDKIREYKLIVDEYFNNSFKKADAVRTVRNDPEMSLSTASSVWQRLSKVDEIKDYIIEKHDKASEKLEITHNDLLRKLKDWVDADYTEAMCLTEEDIKKLPIEFKRLIKGWKKSTTEFDGGTKETFEIHFVSKEKALEMVAKHINFYEKEESEAIEIVITDNRKP